MARVKIGTIALPNISPFLLKDVRNIKKVATLKLNAPINQCQGFTYNSKTKEFVLACISSDNNTQVLYNLNSTDFSRTKTVQYTDKNRLGHCNTLTYNSKIDKIIVTNGAVNENQITYLNPDLSISTTKTIVGKAFNIAYDDETDTYVSITPGVDNSSRNLDYYDASFTKTRSEVIAVNSKNNDSNGALFHKGQVIFYTEYLVNKANIGIQFLETIKGVEVEDFAIKDGNIYMAVNNNSQVDIYCHYSNMSFIDNIATNDKMSLANNTPLYGIDTTGELRGLIKCSNGNGTEVGNQKSPMALVGTRITWFDDKGASRTLLSTKELDGVGENKEGKVIYRASEVDKMFTDVLNKLKEINSKL
jgi:hypothetical protein